MEVLVKSSNGINMVTADSKLLSQRKIFIEGEITSETAMEFIKQVILLNAEDPKRNIDVLINSPGGDINSGMLMYDVIQSSGAPIRIFCTGKAYSMGAVLFACGNNGRYMLPHSELMLHEPLLGSSVRGNCSSIKSLSESLSEAKQKMNEILAKHTGKSVKELEKATSYDHFFDAKESIAFGLCDEIVDFNMIMEG